MDAPQLSSRPPRRPDSSSLLQGELLEETDGDTLALAATIRR